MQFKKINPAMLVYHYFQRSPSEFVLFDDEMDLPIIYGSRNLVDSTVRKLSSSVTIIYYKRDNSEKAAFKRNVIYKGKKPEPSLKPTIEVERVKPSP